jgi:PKD repeat protein
MKQLSTQKLRILFAFLALFSTAAAFAQPATKDLNIYHDPMVMVPGYKAPEGDAAAATVVTIGDYDNFKLGVDFAECSITTNPLNPLEMYAVWNTTGTAGGKGYRTTNGYDWAVSNPSWTGMSGDVVVVSDSTGRLIYENMYGSSIAGCKVATSENFGQTWNTAVVSISGNDKNWIAADQTGGAYSNYLYTTMTNNGSGNHARSINNGTSFSNTQTFNTQSLPGMMVAVGPQDALQGGSVYVVTNSGSSFASTYTFYESNDGGQTYTYRSAQSFSNYVGTNVGGRNSVQNMRTRPYPFIAVDNSNGPHRGRLYVVYASNFPAGDNHKPDIFCRYSDNHGVNWSAAKTVNDDANTVNNHNWFPAIWNDAKTGRLYISWMDTRDCPTSDSAMIYASYTDDGETFAANQQISNKKMKINCTTCGGGGSPAYYGDYNGVASTGNGSILAWTDFRENNFASYVSYFPDFGMRAEPALDTVSAYAEFKMVVPSVKLFTDTVVASASVTASPGLFSISYPEGKKLWAYPGEIPIRISSNNAPVGDYVVTITATGSNGTPVHKRTVTLRIVAAVAPTASFTASNLTPCEGQNVSFTDLSSGPPSSWQWSFPGGNPSSSTEQNPTVVYNQAGTYSVSLTVLNQMGTNTVTLNDYITVNPSPVAPVSEAKSCCYGQPVPDLTAEGTDLIWYYQGTVAGTGTSLTTGQTSTGTYIYQVTQTTNGCESQPTPVTLTIHELPNVYLAPLDSVCAAAPAFNLAGGTPAGGTYSGDGISNGLTMDPLTAGPGNHTITYNYTDEFGCASSYSQIINVKPIPEVSLAEISPVCLTAGPVILSGTPAGGTFSGPGVSADTLYPAIAGAGSVNVTYTYVDPLSGCFASASRSLTIHALPDAMINDSSVCGNRKLIFDATISNPQSYLWMPGNATTPTFQIDTAGRGLGSHTFYVTVTDANGCVASDSAVVNFYDCTGIEEMADSKLIELFPNPSTGNFALRSLSLAPGSYDILVFDAPGRIVYSENGIRVTDDFIHQMNLAYLDNGIYFLLLKSKQNGYSKRFIINK